MAKKTHNTAEQARDAILDAAEKIVVSVGPAGLRISAVAKQAKMAHPNIIHHFGSRQGLLNAVAERVGQRASKRITGAINDALLAQPEDRVAAMRNVLDVSYPGDDGKLAVWLHISGAESSMRDNMHRIVEASHKLRQSVDQDNRIDIQSTNRLVMLVTFALIGEVVAGFSVKEALGFDQQEADFRQWLAELLLNLNNDQYRA